MKKFVVFYILFALVPWTAEGRMIKADYDVDVGVFDAAQMSVSYVINPKLYDLQTTVTTDGVFDAFYPFKASYHASGYFKEQRAQSTDYQYKAQSRSHLRTKRLIFNAQGLPIMRESAKDGKQKTVAVEPFKDVYDAHDLFSVFALLNRQIQTQGKCAANLKVFDGKKQYVVTTQDEGEEILPKKPDLPLKKCSLQIEEAQAGDEDALWQMSSNRPMFFWLATEPETGLSYIVQIQIASTPLGKVVARLENLEVKD